MRPEIPIAGGGTATPINLKKRVELVASRYSGVQNPRFLDCGCGAGDYVSALSERGWDAFGVEFLQSKIQQARDKGYGPERIAQGDLQELSYESNSFDALFFNEVLEHVPSDHKALNEAHRILRDKGHLFVFSPNRFYPFESHGVHVKRTRKRLPVWIPFIPYLPMFAGRHLFDYWARNYWPFELRSMIRRAGFRIVDTSYVWQTFEGISGDSSKWLRALRPRLRVLSSVLERTPVLKCLGVSQFIHATKVAHSGAANADEPRSAEPGAFSLTDNLDFSEAWESADCYARVSTVVSCDNELCES